MELELTLLPLALILWAVGWLLARRLRPVMITAAAETQPSFTVIIPARNEENNLPTLLGSIASQLAEPFDATIPEVSLCRRQQVRHRWPKPKAPAHLATSGCISWTRISWRSKEWFASRYKSIGGDVNGVKSHANPSTGSDPDHAPVEQGIEHATQPGSPQANASRTGTAKIIDLAARER